eukprot:Tamp_12742.p1 GENE.Tamp_12742~~Tamp_12742.p1  ORF type:complete len:426 (+),score=131.06 Tamp_12742:22-1278(+)
MPPQRGGLLLVVATAVAAVTLLAAVPHLRGPPGAAELAAMQPATAQPPAQPARPAAQKQQALRQGAAASRSARRVAAVPAAVRPARKARKAISGKAIFARMVTVLGRVAKAQRSKAAKPAPKPPADLPMAPKFATKAFKQALALQSLAAEEVNEDGEIDVNDDPPAQTVYVYRGRETKTKTDELVTFILAGGFGIPDIKYIESSSDADMRKALWDEDCRAVIFPPLKDIPDFGPNAVKDMRAYVSHGMHHSGTMLFMGSSVEVHLINDIFGYQLEQDFKPGPYYKNERGVLQTALASLPSRVNELGNTESLGVLKSSMPPEARSYYDSFGDSVAMCVRYDLGRVCYLAQDFKPLMQMPELQLELVGANDEDEEIQREAERELEALGRKTDTWLAIFQGMLETPEMPEIEYPPGTWSGF